MRIRLWMGVFVAWWVGLWMEWGWVGAETYVHHPTPHLGLARVQIAGQLATASCSSEFGFLLLYREGGSQVGMMRGSGRCVVSCAPAETIEIALPITDLPQGKLAGQAIGLGPGPVEVALGWSASAEGSAEVRSAEKPLLTWQTVQAGQAIDLESTQAPPQQQGFLILAVRAPGAGGPCAVQWRDLRFVPVSVQAGSSAGAGAQTMAIPIWAKPTEPNRFPPPVLPTLHPAMEQAMIEWDWRMQDGLCSPRVPSTCAKALQRTLERGDALLADLQNARTIPAEWSAQWNQLRERFQQILQTGQVEGPEGESLWLEAHRLRRQMALANPLFPRTPLVFVKHPHSLFSHQLTQYPGNCARPGGGVFVLEDPGRSMRCRELTAGQLPTGAYQFVDISYDGSRVLFSYCPVDRVARNREEHLHVFFHLYEIGPDGTGLRQLTSGPYDDFAGRYLPDGHVMFVSTRRGGFHRCGQGPCPVHTLALCRSDGSQARVISFHETHEWDPAVLQDGRVIYTRWDYVDRNAVFYQQLWTVRPDGTDVRIFYGNNTLSPVGIWEAQAVPGSHRVMATAAAHHAMTAGSIVLVDVGQGVDGPQSIERLTPDALFPESEVAVIRGDGRPIWHNPVGVTTPAPAMEDQERWPGHCYKSPFPFSEKYFLAAYSFDRLIGEPDPNVPNMFGVYWVDRFGNKELLYRDLNISSLWPTPLRPRTPPPVLPSLVISAAPRNATSQNTPKTPDGFSLTSGTLSVSSDSSKDQAPSDGLKDQVSSDSPKEQAPSEGPKDSALQADFHEQARLVQQQEGLFFLQDVYRSWPVLPADTKIHRLRIVQVLPKSTWHINQPTVGLANASPGRQVLGTVPVEADGSALFRAPAGVPLAFQALNQAGEAVQMMRSITYLQPGEICSCVGCHEPRSTVPAVFSAKLPLALRGEPSRITPGPDGTKPFSYPRLVQPVLDKHCVRCHNPQKAEANVILTGEPQGRYTVSYNVLAPRVPFSAWGGKPGDFRKVNSEPMTQPGFFGARASGLLELLQGKHYEVHLPPEDYERIVTWMDTNALFYGTFDPADQARQQRGELISGPALQ